MSWQRRGNHVEEEGKGRKNVVKKSEKVSKMSCTEFQHQNEMLIYFFWLLFVIEHEKILFVLFGCCLLSN